MIYLNVFVVDCKLGPWSEGRCNATCGTSTVKLMTRQIEQQALYGGKECAGRTKKTENCGFEPCPSRSLFISFYLYFDVMATIN